MQQCKSCGLESCNYACSCERGLSSFVHHLLFERMQHADTYRWLPRWFPGLACFFLLGASLLLGNWTAFALTSPVLKVSPTSFNANTACSSNTSAGWTCTATLSRGDTLKKNLSWSASSSGIAGITFSPATGILPAGGTAAVSISVPNIACPASATLVFKGPGNTVDVPWSCAAPSPPKLTVSPTSLAPTSAQCTSKATTYQCVVSLGETASSQGTVRWNASSDLSGVIFSPTKGQLSPGQPALVTIAAIPCQGGTFTFSGAEGETPVKVSWSCAIASNLTITSKPAVALTLNGKDQTVSYKLTFAINNTALQGWHVTITSLKFASNTHILSSTASYVSDVTAGCTSGSCAAPNNQVTYPIPIPASNAPPPPVTFYNSVGSGSGIGTFTVTATINIVVPGNAYAGTYTGTIIVTLITGNA